MGDIARAALFFGHFVAKRDNWRFAAELNSGLTPAA